MYKLALSFFLVTIIMLVSLGFRQPSASLLKDEVDVENLAVEFVLNEPWRPEIQTFYPATGHGKG